MHFAFSWLPLLLCPNDDVGINAVYRWEALWLTYIGARIFRLCIAPDLLYQFNPIAPCIFIN